MNLLQKKKWSAYLAGIIIGLLQLPTYFLAHSSLGTSRAYSSIVCIIDSIADTGNISFCFDNIKNVWQLSLVLGIILGSWLSKKLSSSVRPPISPIWTQLYSPQYKNIKRYLLAFTGGGIVMIGSSLGTGCTSGNGISGIALLQVGSFIVIIFMFIGGIITVKLLNKLL
jgi:uncharacterized membrane protein YedE/YeeE